mgnify:CR=1 FL=1
MRAKRSGQAAKTRRRRWGVVALVLAGLALCLLAALPVQAARNTKKYCFPLDTAAWRISDAYGARTDPFTGKPAFHAGIDLDVNLHLNAAFYGVFGERRAVFCRIRTLRNVVFGKHVFHGQHDS